MKHANSILESSEYFCQISSKSIHIISSYTVSKLGRFFSHSLLEVTKVTLVLIMYQPVLELALKKLWSDVEMFEILLRN